MYLNSRTGVARGGDRAKHVGLEREVGVARVAAPATGRGGADRQVAGAVERPVDEVLARAVVDHPEDRRGIRIALVLVDHARDPIAVRRAVVLGDGDDRRPAAAYPAWRSSYGVAAGRDSQVTQSSAAQSGTRLLARVRDDQLTADGPDLGDDRVGRDAHLRPSDAGGNDDRDRVRAQEVLRRLSVVDRSGSRILRR